MIKNLLKTLLRNPVLANILMVLIIVSGILGCLVMVREIFPRFSLNVISVTVAYPGADPEEVEEGICIKLEEALDGVEGVKKVTTKASEGAGSAVIECKENADVNVVKDDIKTLVDGITTFPVDAERPIVSEIKFRGDVCAIVIWGDLPEKQLKELARKLERELLSIKGVSQASISGIRKYEISIELSEGRLRQYGIDFNKVAAAVRKNGLNLHGGTIRTTHEDMRIRALGRRYRAKDYRNIPIITRNDGVVVTLGQIADIRDTFDEDAKLFALFNGKPAVAIDVYKTEEEDAITISEIINDFIEKKRTELPPSVHLSKFRDRSRMIIDRLNILIGNGKIGLILVFISLWLFLDLRLSFWVTMGIPISLAGGLAIMAMLGGSINMLSLFGMIMVLGLIVDDAIVVGESVYSRRRDSHDKALDAAINGTSEVALPVVAAVLTTIVAFIPLFYIGGVMGKFIRQIPIPVVAALAVSLVEGLFILPVHLRHLPAEPKHPKFLLLKIPFLLRSFTSKTLRYFIDNFYGPFLDRALHWRYVALSIAVAILMIMAGLCAGGVIKFVFFPPSDSDFIRAKIELPSGTPIERTAEVSRQILASWREVEKKFKKDLPPKEELTVAVYALIGGSVRFEEQSGQTNKLEVAIELLPSENRNIHYEDLVNVWRDESGDIAGAIATNFDSYQKGPGGNPIEIKILGDNWSEMLEAADELKEKLKSIQGLFDVQVDFNPGKREFVIDIKPEAHNLGLTLDDIIRHVQGGFYGNEALRIQRGRDDVKVKVRYPVKDGRDSIEYFERLRVKTPTGNMVPFLSVATVDLREGQSVINRKNRRRMVSVSSNINNKKANAEEILRTLKEDFLPKLCNTHNVSYSIEGQREETQNSLGSLLIGFPLALFGIYFIIASIFRSYIQPLVIMATIPFGLIGGVIGHMIFNLPITMMSLFGMVALAGIVVNDAIVLIEGVNMRLESGMTLFKSLREGGKRRFRAILLTTITTCAGLMPLILEKSMQAQFLIPMAISIAFGVFFATVLTLVLIPCLIAILNDIRRYSHLICFLKFPTREEIEPRSSLRAKNID